MIPTKISKAARLEELIIYRNARSKFDVWAGYGGSADSLLLRVTDIERLQLKLGRWEVLNFSLQPSWTGVLGVFEELGELEESESEEWTYETDDKIIDAVGDVAVFTSNLFYKNRMSIDPLFGYMTRYYRERKNLSANRGMSSSSALIAVGRLSHVMLKAEQKIRGYDDPEVVRRDLHLAVSPLLAYAAQAAAESEWTLTDCYRLVGEKILTRDWRNNPTDAHKVAAAVD